MGAAAVPFIGPGISLLGSLFGGVSGANQQSQLGSAASGLLNNNVNYATQLMNTFLPVFQSLLPQLTANMNQYQPGINGAITSLRNFNPLTSQEIGNLQGTINKGAQSGVNSLMSRVGGIANPGKVAEDILGQGSDNALSLASNLGVEAGRERLQAQEGAGQLGLGAQGQGFGMLDNLLNMGGSMTGSAFNGLNNIANTLFGAGSAMGNPIGSMFQQFGSNPIWDMFGNRGGGQTPMQPPSPIPIVGVPPPLIPPVNLGGIGVGTGMSGQPYPSG